MVEKVRLDVYFFALRQRQRSRNSIKDDKMKSGEL